MTQDGVAPAERYRHPIAQRLELVSGHMKTAAVVHVLAGVALAFVVGAIAPIILIPAGALLFYGSYAVFGIAELIHQRDTAQQSRGG